MKNRSRDGLAAKGLLGTSLCKNICSIFGFLFIDPGPVICCLLLSIDRSLILKLVETIFSVEREYMKGDEIDLSYNNIGDLLSVTPEK